MREGEILGIRDLPTKNNLIKLQSSIKQSKNGYKLLEQKKLILTRELEKYKDKQKEIIKKTYEIFDANHNPLKIDDCWMEREDYIKYKSFDELNTALKIPLEDSSKEEVKEIEEKQLETEE